MRFLLPILLLITIASCGTTKKTDSQPKKAIELTFEDEIGVVAEDEEPAPYIDFGNVKMSDVKTHRFWFKNTGTDEVEIEYVSGECTCTEAADWTKGKIKPGERGFIDLIYRPARKPGEYGKQHSGATMILTYRDPQGYPSIYSIKFKSFVEK